MNLLGFNDIGLSQKINNFPYLIIETEALDAGEFTNLVNVSTTTDEEDLTNNDANASVIVFISIMWIVKFFNNTFK